MRASKLNKRIENKDQSIFIPNKVKTVLGNRYGRRARSINLDGSYKYQKMRDLIDKEIYMEVINCDRGGKYKVCGYINVFDLHQSLEGIILQHIKHGTKKLYTKDELKYIAKVRHERGIVVDKYGYVVKDQRI